MAISTVKVEDLNRARRCVLPLRLATSRWNSGLALLPPGSRVPARATEGADRGQASRKKAREGCGQHGPEPLDACSRSATVAAQGREPGSQCRCHVPGGPAPGVAPGIDARQGRDAERGSTHRAKARSCRMRGVRRPKLIRDDATRAALRCLQPADCAAEIQRRTASRAACCNGRSAR